MYKYLYIILLFLFPFLLQAQPTTVRGEFQKVLTETPANGGTYAARGFFFDSGSFSYGTTDIKTDTTMLMDEWGRTYRIVYKSGAPTNLLLEFDPISASTDLAAGKAQLGDPINFDLNANFFPETGGVTDKTRGSNETLFREQVLDSLDAFGTQLTTITASSPLAIADQLLTGNRLVSGSDTYYIKFDSLSNFHLNSTEYFMTDDSTGPLSFVSTVDRWNKANTGLLRINSLGLEYLVLQNTDNSTLRNTVQLEPEQVRIYSVKKRALSVAEYGGVLEMKSNYTRLENFDSLSQGASITIDHKNLEITGTDSLTITLSNLLADDSQDTVLAINTYGRVYKRSVSSIAGGVSYDDYSSGTVTAQATRFGGSTTTITNPAAGQYQFTANDGAYLESIDVNGNNANLDGSNQLIIIIDNATNSRNRYFNVQLIDKGSNGQVNPVATGTAYTQVLSGNQTTITFPNMNGFGASGYTVMLR